MKRIRPFVFLAFPLTALVCILRPPVFIAELVHSLSVQITLLFLLLGMALMARNHYRSGISAAASGLAIGLALLPWIIPGAQPARQQAPHLRVAHFNVLYHNSSHLPLIQQALDTNADFISFQEVTAEWADALEEHLAPTYPHAQVVRQPKGKGIAVFSKSPMEEVEVLWQDKMPYISGKLCVNDQPVQFLAAHTRTPTRPSLYAQRNRQLGTLASQCSAVQCPSLVVGDLNTVPWSPELKRLLTTADLQDSREGLSPTFPTWLTPARIPIDYILHSGELQCVGFRTVDSTGSDHLGIVSDFVWAGSADERLPVCL